MMRSVLLLSVFVVAVYTFPTESKSDVTNFKKIISKRSVAQEKAAITKRSRYDTFTKFDLDGNDLLDKLELAYFFYVLGFDVDAADFFADEQLRLLDVDGDNKINRWEWERKSHDEMKPLENLYY